MIYRTIYILAVLVALAACSGVKNLAKPDTDMPETYMPDMQADSACVADMKWWEFYTDATLCKLITMALDNNHDLLKTAAKVEEARLLYGVDKLNYLPEISGQVGGSHETNKYNGIATTKDPEYDIKATISWEANLFGALSWAQKSGLARYEASVDDLRAMRLTLIAEVAATYYRLIALRNELSIVNQTLATRQESLKQARIRYDGGLTSETVYQQAKVEYATAAALVPNLQTQLKKTGNALTLLLGEYPRNVLGPDLTMSIDLPQIMPTGIPSTLLQRRPDVKAAEHRLAASMADVGVAYANRFPNFRLTFTPGWENESLSHLLASPFTYVAGNVVGSIFDFGKKKRKYQAAIAVYNQSKYDYEKAVVNAFTEVNTAIETYNQVKENGRLKFELLEATTKYVNLARLQYRAGSLNYIDVLDAQRRYFDAQIAVSNAIRDEYLALINLYKVLGGGWETAGK